MTDPRAGREGSLRTERTQAIRYLVVGTIAFGIDFGITWRLTPAFPLLFANSCGFLAANLANFALAHHWVFGHPWTASAVLRAYASVLAISMAGLFLNDLAVWVLVGVAGVALFPGKVAATAIVLAWNYLARIIWVYRRKAAS